MASISKCFGIVGESPGSDHKTTRSTFGRHHAIQLAHHVHTDLECFPLLALDKEFFAALGHDQINATVRPATPIFDDAKALQSERFTHQHLKFTPGHPVKRIGALSLCNVCDQGSALPTSKK